MHNDAHVYMNAYSIDLLGGLKPSQKDVQPSLLVEKR